MMDSLWPHWLQSQAPLPFTISLSLLKLMSTEPILLSNHLNIFYPLLFLPSIFPSVNIFSNELALCLGAKVLELQRQSFQWIFRVDFFRVTGWISLLFKGLSRLAVQGTVQESFPAPQLESISSSALSLLYGPALTSEHDYWKNHCFAARQFFWVSFVSLCIFSHQK